MSNPSSGPIKMYNQLVLVTFYNGGNFLYNFKSREKITMDMVVKFLVKTQDWNENKDNIEFCDSPEEVTL
jgi:hypothetical protein